MHPMRRTRAVGGEGAAVSEFAGQPRLTDVETAEMLLDEARGRFSAAEQAFDFFVFSKTADYLLR